MFLGSFRHVFLHLFLFLIYNKSQNFLSGNPYIHQRVMMQLSWILLGSIIFIVYEAIKRWDPSKGDVKAITGFLILIFAVVQIFPLVSFYRKQIEIKILSIHIKQHPFTNIPAEYVIVSNVPEITYYFSQRSARALNYYTPSSLYGTLGTHRKFVVLLVKKAGFLSPAWQYVGEWRT